MAIRIKVSRQEFNQSDSNGAVYGRFINRVPQLYVYAELGIEREYIPTATDDANTDYRMFTNSLIEFYRSKEDLDDNRSIREEIATLIIYT